MNMPTLTELNTQDANDGIEQQVVGAIIDHQGEILLLKRPIDDFRGGTWELPSGKVERHDADLFAALRREVSEETGLIIADITGYLGAFDYTSGSGKRTRQHTWSTTQRSVDPREDVVLTEHDNQAWVTNTSAHSVSSEVQHLVDTHFTAVTS